MIVFDIFRKKRIDRYAHEAGEYLVQIYKPIQETKSAPSIRYSLRDTSDDAENDDRGRVQYSLRGTSDVLKDGDRFHSDAVKQLLSNTSLSKEKMTNILEDNLNPTFVDMLTRYINMKGWRDSKVYKAAQIDRRLFSKMMSDREYKPAKDTALALAIALELTLQQTNDLLDRAGYTLSHSNKRDVIIEYFIREGVHNLGDINEVLYKLDQKIIGR